MKRLALLGLLGLLGFAARVVAVEVRARHSRRQLHRWLDLHDPREIYEGRGSKARPLE